MELFPGADADRLEPAPGRDCTRDVDDPRARDLGDKDLAPMQPAERMAHQLHALLERDPEARHPLIGDRNDTGLPAFQEQRNHAAPASHDIAVADDGEARVPRACVGVRGDEDLVGAQLGRTVQVDRVGRLVRAERDDAAHAGVDRRIDHIHRPHHVRLDVLERIVLGGRYLLQRRRMHDGVDAIERPAQALFVPHVPQEEPQARLVAILLSHVMLLQLVPAEHDQSLRLEGWERHLHELAPE